MITFIVRPAMRDERERERVSHLLAVFDESHCAPVQGWTKRWAPGCENKFNQTSVPFLLSHPCNLAALLSRLRVVEHPLHVVADPRVHAGDALGAAEPRAEAHDPDYPPDGQWFWPTSFLHFTKRRSSFTSRGGCGKT